ncbi:conserved oligomeric Golgi complex subunit 1-like [Dendronephthya gigantea]|uniref:conserved oligomeric Golgi complex subunit 1-like n=1 Tax=Dendronephthya gigantea TaxID=151771 RepID=UPI00106BFF08|nr:conserved oligomeric Golgi complex subunit 1-like [Dendronephthya gigantea]
MATDLSSSIPPTSPRHTGNFSRMGAWDAEEDAQNLFQKHSVVEIRELEKRARGDIERKKEELRLMVGERYRDLIDAADTIREMKDCSDKVNGSIRTIQGNCKQLYQTHQSRGVSGEVATPSTVNQPKGKFYSVASQMKLLVDTPEKLWNALENHEYLKAAQLYLLAQNIVSSLHIDTGGNNRSKLLTSFPILPQQWSSISHFKDSILQGSRKLLRDYTQSEQTIAECLCAIMFLEDSSPRQVFNEFLLARQVSLQELFHPSQQATGIKIQLCEVARLIMSSLYQTFVLFSSEDATPSESENPPSLLFDTVNKITSRNESSSSEGDLLKQLFGQEFDLTLLRHLPTSVVGFRPRVRSISNFIPADYIQSNCKTWFQKCVEDVKKNLGDFLQYVGTLKGLASIRDAIWELMNPTLEDRASSYHNSLLRQWDAVTDRCLGSSLSLWRELFKDEFVSRSKAILHGQLEAMADSCKTSTTKALEDLASKGSKPDPSVLWERDLSLYVWHESLGDLPAKTGKQFENEATRNEGGLTFKTKACTPVIQGLCGSLNSRLGHILDDAGYFIRFARNDESADVNKSGIQTPQSRQNSFHDHEEGPFDRFGESKTLEDFLQTTCSDAIKNLLSHFNSLLEAHEDELKKYPWEKTRFGAETEELVLAVDRVLLLARLCRGLAENCSNIGELMGEKKEEKSRKTRYQKTSHRKRERLLSNRLQEIKELLKETCTKAFGIWSQWVSTMFQVSFDIFLLHDQNPNSLLSATNWDEIVIDEETESGQKVHSSIYVPSQISSYVTSLLFSLCEEINRVGGHAIDRFILRDLVQGLSDNVLRSYEKLLDRHKDENVIDQNRALQTLFDFRFLSSVFGDRSKSEDNGSYKSRYEKIVETLEDIVDPFDLNVFSPYINSNLNKHLQRCGVLYGVLLNIDKHNQFYGMPQRPGRGPQDQHNVMPIAINPVRFTLLPLSSHHTEKHEPHNKHVDDALDEMRTFNIPFCKHQEFLMKEILLDKANDAC